MKNETDVQIQQMTRRIAEEYPGVNFEISLSDDAQRAQVLQMLLNDSEYDLAIAENSEPGSLCAMRTTEFTSMIISVLLVDRKADLSQLLGEFAEISADFEDCLDKIVEAWKKVTAINSTGIYAPDPNMYTSKVNEEDFRGRPWLDF